MSNIDVAGVRVVGKVPHEQVEAFYRSAAVVVAPSVWPDPCPTVVLEAMAGGRPVVAGANGGIVDMLDDGVTGRLVAPGDAHALSQAIGMLLDDPVTAAAMGKAAAADVHRYTSSVVVPQVEGVYRTVQRHRL